MSPMSWKLCVACKRDPDARGPSACDACRELNTRRVLPVQLSQYVAGLSRAVDDHIAAFHAADGHDFLLTRLALDGAVRAYYQAERLGESDEEDQQRREE
jgi:hypothetical protein